MKTASFLSNIDTNKVNELLTEVDNNVEYFLNITDKIVYSYTNDLDMLMQSIQTLINSDIEIDSTQLDKYVLSLSNMLYFVSYKSERVGIKADISKSIRQEIYNKAYLNNQLKDSDKKNKTTIAENVAVAEEQSKYESVIQSIYDRVYKILKLKVDAGYELLSSLKKIISRRMQEADISRFQNN